MALYSIGYVAQHYGVAVSTIRRWKAKGIIPKSVRTLGGYCRFDLSSATNSYCAISVGEGRSIESIKRYIQGQ